MTKCPIFQKCIFWKKTSLDFVELGLERKCVKFEAQKTPMSLSSNHSLLKFFVRTSTNNFLSIAASTCVDMPINKKIIHDYPQKWLSPWKSKIENSLFQHEKHMHVSKILRQNNACALYIEKRPLPMNKTTLLAFGDEGVGSFALPFCRQ